MVAPDDPLPFIDRYDLRLEASPERVWAALVRVLPRAFGGRRAEAFARFVGCETCRHDGTFPEAGAHVVGFHVAAVDPPRHLVLRGSHRFAAYELGFDLEQGADGTLLSATTRARFPGLPGRLYRLAVIGTGGHVIVVRRFLKAVRHRAEEAR